MVVIGIIAVMGAAVALAIIPQFEEAKRKTAITDIRSIENGLKLYYVKTGKYPDTSTGLQLLVDQQILETIKDPWGNPYIYTLEGGKPVIVSYGKDGAPGGEGPDADISNRQAPPSK
jgi:general secretion pathway protein G